jgi:hypothetical protein
MVEWQQLMASAYLIVTRYLKHGMKLYEILEKYVDTAYSESRSELIRRGVFPK